MKTQSPESIAKSATRWITAAVVLLIYIGLLSMVWTGINWFLKPAMERYNTIEIYRTAWDYTDDYWISPSSWDEHLQEDVINRVSPQFYLDGTDDARQRISEIQEKIDALQPTGGESP